MSDLKRINIKITGVEKKVASNGSIFFNIKDENNKNYKLWKTVKDGSDSKAYQALMNLPNEGLGQTIGAGVELQTGEFNGKPVTYRTIKAIGRADELGAGEPRQTASGDQMLRLEAAISRLEALLNKNEVVDEGEISIDELKFN